MTDSMIAAFSAAALVLLLRSALGLSRGGGSDPSDQARSMTLALYGCGLAVVTLGMFVTFP